MAMINCPKCNKEISDKSTKCVHCGAVLVEEPKLFCEECGTELKKNAKICSNCGCPVAKVEKSEPQQVEVTKVKLGGGISKKAIIITIISILAIAGIVFGIIMINKNNEKKKAAELSAQYKENLSTLTYKMLSGAADAEKCGNKIRAVWSNTIWEESDPETDKFTKKNGKFNDDFNDSLTSLFIDSEFVKLTDSVKQNQNQVKTIMKDMKNPPQEWEEAYKDLKQYYDDYLTLTNLCVNPSGSLQTYSTNFSQADTNTVNGYDKMKSYLDY